MTFEYELWDRIERYSWEFEADPRVIKILIDNSVFVGNAVWGKDPMAAWKYELNERGYTHLSLYRGTDQDILSYLEATTQSIQSLIFTKPIG